MKALGYFLAACVALAAVRAAVAALLVALLVALAWGCLFRPAQALGLIGTLALAGLLQAHPWAFVALLATCALLRAGSAPDPRDTTGDSRCDAMDHAQHG